MQNTIERLSVWAGPCSLDSRQNQGLTSVQALKNYVDAVRLPPVKPRSEDSWTGLGNAAIPIIKDIKQLEPNVPITMEASTARDTEWMLQVADHLWLGSRQNPNNSLEIADVLRGVDTIGMFAVKNPTAPDEKAWIGAINVLRKRLHPNVKIVAIHRGFCERNKPQGWRNNPDEEMAMRVAKVTGVDMWLDPSHLIGNRELIKQFIFNGGVNLQLYRGIMLEADPDPIHAQTDQKQQLYLPEALQVIRLLQNEYESLTHDDLEGAVIL